MAEAILSSKYQLVIPKQVREESGVRVGEKLILIVKDGIIHMIPAHRILKLRGFLKGLDGAGIREDDDR